MQRSEMLGFQLAFDVTGDPAFPEKAAFEAARELDVKVTTHAGVWGATNDNGIRLMHEHGFMTPGTVYVHAATLSDDSYQRIAATGGYASVSAESECSCGQGYPSSWVLRQHGIPISLSVDTSVWFSADPFAAMRSTLSTDRAREHHEAHALGETVTHLGLRAEQVVDWGTRGGAKALGLDEHRRQPRAGQARRRDADQERPVAGDVPDPAPVRPRRLPGAARRRAHGAGQRQGRQARRPARRTSTSRRRAGRSRAPSSTCAARSARRSGTRACTPTSRSRRCSTTPTPTPSTRTRRRITPEPDRRRSARMNRGE